MRPETRESRLKALTLVLRVRAWHGMLHRNLRLGRRSRVQRSSVRESLARIGGGAVCIDRCLRRLSRGRASRLWALGVPRHHHVRAGHRVQRRHDAQGTPTLLTATFDDSFGGPNDVRLTMSASGLGRCRERRALALQLRPTWTPRSVTFTPSTTPPRVPNSISTGLERLMADGDRELRHPVRLHGRPRGASAARLTAGETETLRHHATPRRSHVSTFHSRALTIGGRAARRAAHVQQIGPAQSGTTAGSAPPSRPRAADRRSASRRIAGLRARTHEAPAAGLRAR